MNMVFHVVKSFVRGNLIPLFSFLIIFLISFIAYFYLQNHVMHNQQLQFEDKVERAEQEIVIILKDYRQILQAVKNFVEESDSVDRQEWKFYVDKMKLHENFPGIQGMGYSIFISPGRLSEHIQSVRAQGFPDYTVFPEGRRDTYSSIIYLEPFSGSNLRAFGFDMFSESVRREAMIKAMLTGLPTLSKKVTLIQELTNHVQPGFLLYLPVYRKGINPSDEESRKKLIKGFVYCPFRAHQLFDAILHYRFPKINIQIYDGGVMSREHLLYNKDSIGLHEDHVLFEKSKKLEISGNTWIIRYSSLPDFISPSDSNLPFVVLFSGIIISLLVFLLMWFQTKKQAAQKMIIETTAAKYFIIESMPEKVSVADSNGKIQYINKNWLDYTGMEFEQLKTSGWRMVIHDSDWHISENVIHEAFNKGQNYQIEQRLKKHDNTYRWHISMGAPQKDNRGNVLSWVEAHTDIHEQKSQLEELKKTNSDLDNFVYTASHDLKTPITNMEGLMNLLQEEVNEDCKRDVQSIFDMMAQSIKRLRVTISELTEISRIQRSNEGFIESIDIHHIIEEFKLDNKELIRTSDTVFSLSLSVPTIHFSRRNFKSIMYNLLSNAIKYKSPHRRPVVNIANRLQDNCLLLTVEDNGLGLKEHQVDKVFGMFKRMHTHVEGSGIGLYIVKKIIENAGGEIEVHSKENEGSIFSILLPLTSSIPLEEKGSEAVVYE